VLDTCIQVLDMTDFNIVLGKGWETIKTIKIYTRTMHKAGEMIDALRTNSDDYDKLTIKITNADKFCVMLAALLHDIGM
jgi:hypothetical protein